MLSPALEKALLQTSRDAWASFHALALPEDAMLCIAETFRPLIADLEAKALDARREAWAEGFASGFDCSDSGRHSSEYPNPYVLASTDPTGEKI